MRWLTGFLLIASCSLLKAADLTPPQLQSLRIQKVGETTYFHVRFIENHNAPARSQVGLMSESTLMPQLVPVQGAWAVARLNTPDHRQFHRGEVSGFAGKCDGKGIATFRYIAPLAGEAKVQLNFDLAEKVVVPEKPALNEPADTNRLSEPDTNCLDKIWLRAQADELLYLHSQVPGLPYFEVAARLLERQAKLSPHTVRVANRWDDGRVLTGSSRLFEMSTGSMAIAETLQADRLLAGRSQPAEPRKLAVSSLRGIDIAEHPWEKMMAGQVPAAEPLAEFIPHDNYYVYFRTPAALLQFAGLLDTWGGHLNRFASVPDRDFALRQRYERQLGLTVADLAQEPLARQIRGIAVTGSDVYLLDGSDVTLILETADPAALRAALPKAQFAGKLRQDSLSYQGVAIEQAVSPHREVSSYRATMADCVLCSNSLPAIQRVIDTRAGRRAALMRSLDFRYMRTIFRADDASESGFAYLSDSFIRTMVGPASKIAQKRRGEAMTSLILATNAALFAHSQHGKIPADTAELVRLSGITADELAVPDGPVITWDGRVARSEVYGTIHFATPLIENPVEQVTPSEADNYEQFRRNYATYWRQFFDPIGMRLSLAAQEVKLETYILPLIENSIYNRLRETTGGKGVAPEAVPVSDKTLIQYIQYVNPQMPNRWNGGDVLGIMNLVQANMLGDWFLVRLDDNLALGRLLKLMDSEKQEQFGPDFREMLDEFSSLPLVFGVEIRNPVAWAAAMSEFRERVLKSLPGAVEWEPLPAKPGEPQLSRIQATKEGLGLLNSLSESKMKNRPALYYGVIDGAFYVSLQEQPLRDIFAATREGKRPAKMGTAVNTHLQISPAAAKLATNFLQQVVKMESRYAAIRGGLAWESLYRCGLLKPTATSAESEALARQYLGYVPTRHGQDVWRWDAQRQEVRHDRFGSYTQANRQAEPPADSPYLRLAQFIRNVDVSLKFREDGIHTILTLKTR